MSKLDLVNKKCAKRNFAYSSLVAVIECSWLPGAKIFLIGMRVWATQTHYNQ
jgi:hypothetical protein